ncbi:uncharacterized protein CMU_020020 [Cryptosporidium muris RN66]|uniref:Uncharacterized protein n=1 Tax=Cryptosporidium muris (strain RN66) TaxID=441375 RepID=B6AJC1_CRYMR|nr:uncharacterized protein CMU_020020 [Cryptosporidium muris RN66]EEA08259.1 hypothetical protein CMU_020020 [Cryptosporidium muris RN66]|eukprot:XP_002142608.1 hypothetical protein [Cryptosporidium muris RN66]
MFVIRIGNQLYIKHDSDEFNSEFNTTNTSSNSTDILYDNKTGLPIFYNHEPSKYITAPTPWLSDRDSSNESVKQGLSTGWIVLYVCIAIACILIITVITITVTRHIRTRRLAESRRSHNINNNKGVLKPKAQTTQVTQGIST